MWRNHSINLWRHLNHNLHKIKQVLVHLISQKCKLIQTSQNLPCRGHAPSSWSTTTEYDIKKTSSLMHKQFTAAIQVGQYLSFYYPREMEGKCLLIDYRALNKVRSTYPFQPRSFKMLHSIHGCLRWCLWHSVVTGTQWPRTASCISIPHINRHPMKWSTTEQETYGIYYAVPKWNYYV